MSEGCSSAATYSLRRPSQTQSELVALLFAGTGNVRVSEGDRQDGKAGQALLNGRAEPGRNESVVPRGLSARH